MPTIFDEFVSAFRNALRECGDVFHTEHVDNAIAAAHAAVAAPVTAPVVPVTEITAPLFPGHDDIHAQEGEAHED